MILAGSYANGFAPRDGQPLHPSLWRGCVGAWAPCLGPTGLTLRDWSGRGCNGTFTNIDPATVWVPNGGRYCMTMDGSNDYVDCGLKTHLQLTSRGTLSAWIRKRSANTNSGIIGNVFNNNFTGGFGLLYRLGVPTAVVSNSGSFAFAAMASDTIANGVWAHLACTFSASTIAIYINGILGVSASQTTNASGGGASLLIGNAWASAPSIIYPWIGDLDDLMMHDRALSPQEIRVLASRRGIAYELAPRRRSGVFTAGGFRAYWAARKAQILGGGLQ